MQHKQSIFNLKGLTKDSSVLNFSNEYAFNVKNMRFVTNEENSLLSLVNEKGNKLLNLDTAILGIPLGEAHIKDNFLLFTKELNEVYTNNIVSAEEIVEDVIFNDDITLNISIDILAQDHIYNIDIANKKVTNLFSGNLNFNLKYPIESIINYENEENIKVYWVDGINPFRVINMSASEEIVNKWSNKSFDAIQELNLKELVSIKKTYSNGNFSPGVIQYAFTYFNLYGQESNIFYTSDLYYVSFKDRGGSPEDKISNAFTINIQYVDPKFDYIRIYSIHRSSIDATPTVKVVADLNINFKSNYYNELNTPTVQYIDNNTSGYTIDPTTLLYLGGESIVANTLTAKDNTLFLGNIKIEKPIINNDIRNFFKENNEIIFEAEKELPQPNNGEYYSYENQLKYSSRQIKTFKYLETYRFGIQFQYKTGKWTEPIWINDTRCEVPKSGDYYLETDDKLVSAYYTLTDSKVISDLIKDGFVKVRPVIVYPNFDERECVCQGVLCPTVCSTRDRSSNSPFAQSSWFIRPNLPFDIQRTNEWKKDINGNYIYDWRDFKDPSKNSIKSRAGVLNTLNGTYKTDSGEDIIIDNVSKGSYVEFRHNACIPSYMHRNAELQGLIGGFPYMAISDNESSWVKDQGLKFFVDQSIVTLHSPDIEFDDSILNYDLSNLKLRIVGIVPLTAVVSDIDIKTSTPPQSYNLNSMDHSDGLGLYKNIKGVKNTFTQRLYTNLWSNYGESYEGFKGLVSTACWVDGLYKDPDKTRNYWGTFVIYPWHKIGSLNNTPDTAEYKSSTLERKVMSNLKYSYKTKYLPINDIWYAYKPNSKVNTGISGVVVFNSNEVSLIKLPAPKNSNRDSITYYGNIDTIYTPETYGIVVTHVEKDRYLWEDRRQLASLMSQEYKSISEYSEIGGEEDDKFTGDLTSTNGIPVKYKSSPHAVLALNYTDLEDYRSRILPTIYDNQIYNDGSIGTPWKVNSKNLTYKDDFKYTSKEIIPFWEKNLASKGIHQDVISSASLSGIFNNFKGLQHGFLWLGELYRDNVENRFGGTTEEAFEANQWVPCGEAYSLTTAIGFPKDKVTIKWSEGDTYYQRYDHLKTYPFTQEDTNSIVEIVSFMCESRINLDGRYDRNRGLSSNLHITPQNFNLLNPIYSQQNNIFVYRGLNPYKQNLNNFPTTITWTKTKTLGETIDSWTNITLASTLDLDGSKGQLNVLHTYNDVLLSFQDEAVAQVLYNSNVQIASTAGVPIEIANSNKVEGKRYISNIGCTNKWSICETPLGLYFIDSNNKDIYCYSDKMYQVASTLGMTSWVENIPHNSVWNPLEFNNLVTYYDKNNRDVLFISRDICLAYSEKLGKFSSFYSYESVPYVINTLDNTYMLKYDKGITNIWEHNGGDYNIFFDTYKPFSVSIISNGSSANDKIFNTIDISSEVFEQDTKDSMNLPFDVLHTWNSYQDGEYNLNNIKGFPSNFKKKFRIWRANIPRDKSNSRDRMRNPWLYLELIKQSPNTDKTVLHNITVNYFE